MLPQVLVRKSLRSLASLVMARWQLLGEDTHWPPPEEQLETWTCPVNQTRVGLITDLPS